MKYVDKLAEEYRQHTPIWWYTCECMLNRSLRTMNADQITKLGFFIVDLHRHIEQLHREQFESDSAKQRFTVYRGQGMDNEAFRKIVSNMGGLISFNNFLSTSRDQSTSLKLARQALANVQIV